ncbi:WGR domain-containing protein [Sinorhizobium medicae]|nr:WGR domain-containing protein [Sinorhizobium medicae]
MTQQCSSFCFQRIDPIRNMARYYALSIQPTLFGESTLIRAWGRIGTRGQELHRHFASETEAVALLYEIARRKNAKGYVPEASHGNSEYGIECPMRGAIIDELRFATTRSQAE